ncbi:MAG: hypothetical protein WCJ57_03475, partial [Candidatus Falkowbacteria bacterium]
FTLYELVEKVSRIWGTCQFVSPGCANAGTKLRVGGSTGFDAIMTGHSHPDGTFGSWGGDTFLMSSSMYSSSQYWYRQISMSSAASVYRGYYSSVYGFSLRCLQD